MKVPAADLKLLQKFLDLALLIEKNWSVEQFKKRDELLSILSEFEKSNSPLMIKQAELQKHFKEDLSLNHFVTLIVPFERLADRNLKDDDFLVTTQDQTKKTRTQFPLRVILHNLRSSFNVGSIFRTSECFGIEKIYLCGYTATPEDIKTLKTSMGTAEIVCWQKSPELNVLIQELKSEGYKIIALETAQKSLPLDDQGLSGPTCFILGNERFGVDYETLSLCDEVRQIPTYGTKNSLNVASSFAIAAYEYTKQCK